MKPMPSAGEVRILILPSWRRSPLLGFSVFHLRSHFPTGDLGELSGQAKSPASHGNGQFLGFAGIPPLAPVEGVEQALGANLGRRGLAGRLH